MTLFGVGEILGSFFIGFFIDKIGSKLSVFINLAIVAIMGQQMPDASPVFANTCYSFVSDKMAMHVANVYRYDATKKIMVSAEGGGVSDKPSELEGNYAQAWAKNIWSDVLT